MLNYSIKGEGYPIVFLHGFLESISMWQYLPLQKLECQCILVDLPGHGGSDLCEQLPPSIQSMAELVLELIDHLGIDKFSVVGHSMGGYVGLELKNISERAEKIVLLNSNPWSDSPQKAADRQRVARIVYEAKDLFLKEAISNLFLDPNTCRAEMDTLIGEAAAMDPDAIAYASLAMSTRKDHTSLVISDPKVFFVIQGEGDKIVPLEAMDALMGNQPNYFIIPKAGHMAHIEQTAEVLRCLLTIFQK